MTLSPRVVSNFTPIAEEKNRGVNFGRPHRIFSINITSHARQGSCGRDAQFQSPIRGPHVCYRRQALTLRTCQRGMLVLSQSHGPSCKHFPLRGDRGPIMSFLSRPRGISLMQAHRLEVRISFASRLDNTREAGLSRRSIRPGGRVDWLFSRGGGRVGTAPSAQGAHSTQQKLKQGTTMHLCRQLPSRTAPELVIGLGSSLSLFFVPSRSCADERAKLPTGVGRLSHMRHRVPRDRPSLWGESYIMSARVPQPVRPGRS